MQRCEGHAAARALHGPDLKEELIDAIQLGGPQKREIREGDEVGTRPLDRVMINVAINKQGGLEVGQSDVSRTVYLDHWALRTLSEGETLAGRLVAALNSRNGTLAISWLNVGEFAKVTSAEQARKAEKLVESSLPQVFFVEVEPFKVIDREDKLLTGGPPEAPHADL